MNEPLFQQLFQTHSRQIYSYLLGRTRNRDTAADLMQDVFLKVWNRMDTVERIPEEQRLFWMFSIATNRLKDYYRKSQSYSKAASQMKQTAFAGTFGDGDLSQLIAGREQFRELEDGIRELPEEQRSILLMKVVGEMTSGEIGAALGLPAGTVRYLLMQARRILAEKLGMLERNTMEGRRT